MSLRDPSVVLMLSAVAFVLVLRGVLRSPFREQRIAVLAGVLASLSLLAVRALVLDPDVWARGDRLTSIHVSTSILCTLTLVMVGISYRELRRRTRSPLRLGLIAAAPGVLIVCCLVLLEEGWRGLDRIEILLAMPYNAIVALAAFILPPLAFELLWRTPLWGHRPAEGPRE